MLQKEKKRLTTNTEEEEEILSANIPDEQRSVVAPSSNNRREVGQQGIVWDRAGDYVTPIKASLDKTAKKIMGKGDITLVMRIREGSLERKVRKSLL